jgi:hypothetical protein
MRAAINRRFEITEFKILYKRDNTTSKKRKRSDDYITADNGPKRKTIEMPKTVAKAVKTKCKIGMCADVGPCFCAQNAYVDAKAASMEE